MTHGGHTVRPTQGSTLTLLLVNLCTDDGLRQMRPCMQLQLEHALARLFASSAERGLRVNVGKSALLRVAIATGEPPALPVPIHGVTFAREYRHLGTKVDRKLSTGPRFAHAAKALQSATATLRPHAIALPPMVALLLWRGFLGVKLVTSASSC